jgi:hypothetical protein
MTIYHSDFNRAPTAQPVDTRRKAPRGEAGGTTTTAIFTNEEGDDNSHADRYLS